MDDANRAREIRAGIARAHSFRSPGHWNASTRELHVGWQAATGKLHGAVTPTAVFQASLSRELCAMVLRDRGEMPGA
jgi:hypothetical protein